MGKAFDKVMSKYSRYIQIQKINASTYSTYYTYAFHLKTKKISWKKFRIKFIENGGDPFYAASKLNNQEKAIIKYSIGRCFSSCKLNCLKNCNGTPVAMGLQKKLILLTTNQSNDYLIKKQAISLEKTLKYFFENN